MQIPIVDNETFKLVCIFRKSLANYLIFLARPFRALDAKLLNLLILR